MAGYTQIVTQLRKEEHRLVSQLTNIRNAIASLNNGTGQRGRTATASDNGSGRTRKRRRLSAAARARISAAQKRRWAKVRAAAKG